MRIEQTTTSKMIADAGKVFARKSDGDIVGGSISLGYNYYDAGFPLSQPYAAKKEDYEEIDAPENWEERSPIRQVQRFKRMDELIKQNVAEINTLGLTASQALEVQHWFPVLYETEGFQEGDAISAGTRVQHGGKLWQAMQDHTITAAFVPSIHTAALYCEVTEDFDENGQEFGTLENPIPYEGNMALEEGKYYEQGGIVYLCTRDTGAPVYNSLKDLVGIYVEIV